MGGSGPETKAGSLVNIQTKTGSCLTQMSFDLQKKEKNKKQKKKPPLPTARLPGECDPWDSFSCKGHRISNSGAVCGKAGAGLGDQTLWQLPPLPQSSRLES